MHRRGGHGNRCKERWLLESPCVRPRCRLGSHEGVRTLRRSGIFREVVAAVRDAQVKTAAVTVAKLTNAEWSALTPEHRMYLSAAVENPLTDSAWIVWTVANRQSFTPVEVEMLLNYLATADGPDALTRAVFCPALNVVTRSWVTSRSRSDRLRPCASAKASNASFSRLSVRS